MTKLASSFIQQLLNRDPKERLGSGGANEVKLHPFFADMDWDALLRREIQPPFNPLRGQEAEDTQNFEREFTNLPLFSMDEIGRSDSRAERMSEGTFENFTYEEDSFLSTRFESDFKK